MLKIKILLVFLSFSVVSIAQNKINPNGYSIFYYPNGQIASEGTMHNGQPDGYWKTYYTTGVLKSVGKRTNFLLDSIWVFFSEKGDTTERISYLNGKKNGWYYKYAAYDDTVRVNRVIEKALYVDDLRQGKTMIYYKTGELYRIVPYVKNRRQGTAYEYNRQGKIITILRYNNDILYDKDYINRTNEKNQKVGDWKEFYPDFKLKKEAYYRNGKLDGMVKYYNHLGKLTHVEEYRNGELVQKSNKEIDKAIVKKERYPNGGLKFEGAYKNEKPLGIHTYFNKNGQIDSALEYLDNGILQGKGKVDTLGRKTGVWKEYTKNGKPRAKGKYRKGKRQGKWNFYYPNGKIAQKGSYINGKETGTWQWFYPNGNLRREEEYIRGYADGPSTEYSETGEIIAQGEFLEGERQGKWIIKTGDITLKGSYDNGLRDGVWQYFYSDSTLKFQGEFIQGEPNGWHKNYYPNGKIKSEKYYNMGRREKTWRYYSSEGIVTTTLIYKNDKAIKVDGKKLK